MKNLPSYYYVPVFFKREEIIYDFINPDFLDDIKLNARFVHFACEAKNDFRFYDSEARKKDFEASALFNEEIPVEDIGIKVIQYNDTILKASDYDEFTMQSPWVLTDRYFYPFGFRHIGSSRHALLYNCQLKGVGRNSLTHRGDFLHSWGGYPYFHAVNSMIYNLYIDSVTPLGALPIWATARYKHLSIASELQSPALQIRDSRDYRLSHFDPGTSLSDKTVNKLITQDLKLKFQTDQIDEIKKIVVKQYAAYFQHGINPSSSLIPENLLFSGQAIDTDEFEILLTKSPVLTITFSYQDLITLEEIQKLSFPEIFTTFKKLGIKARCENLFRIHGSWILYSGILDQLFDLPVNFLENHNMLLDSLDSVTPHPIMRKLIRAFLNSPPTTLVPNASLSVIPDDVIQDLNSMSVVDGTFAKVMSEKAYRLVFSSGEKVYPLNYWSGKYCNLSLTDEIQPKSSDMAIASYCSLKQNLTDFIKSKMV